MSNGGRRKAPRGGLGAGVRARVVVLGVVAVVATTAGVAVSEPADAPGDRFGPYPDLPRTHEPCRMLPEEYQPPLPDGTEAGGNLVVTIPATTCNTRLTDAELARALG